MTAPTEPRAVVIADADRHGDLVATGLAQEGLWPVRASVAKEAAQLVGAEGPALLVVGLTLAGVPAAGLDFAMATRLSPGTRHVPIVIVTDPARDGDLLLRLPLAWLPCDWLLPMPAGIGRLRAIARILVSQAGSASEPSCRPEHCPSGSGDGQKRRTTMKTEPTSNRRILVVDDEPDFAAYLQTLLEGAGLEVEVAYDGEDALASVREHRPALVTLDISMPRKTGVLFYREMKSDPRLRDVPVVVITGLRTTNQYAGPFVERFFEVDHLQLPKPDAYLDKPIDKARLLETVNVLVARSAGDMVEA